VYHTVGFNFENEIAIHFGPNEAVKLGAARTSMVQAKPDTRPLLAGDAM